VIDTLGGGKMPRWFAEGIALYVAGEGKLIQQNAKGNAMSPYDLEQKLATAKSPAEMKSVYAAACLVVRDLIRVEGEISCGNVWRSEAMMACAASIAGEKLRPANLNTSLRRRA
jgi:hypothetical protein